ncbi:integrase core domain-containing protein [Microbacterium sp. A82]|uniref:integrase core domain-containing protein n=1 Tax=Microbacterium sp. A82 TaxID=3450452 RepID=UPI003F34A99C
MAYDPSRTDLRLIIASWPADAPRGAVSRFCTENNVSREWFYATRRRIQEDALPQALMPRSSRPRTSPRKTPAPVEALAIEARARLEAEGWDHGPISVGFELTRLGIAPPSRATLARIFTRNGLVTAQPKKRPRTSYIRFRYAAPNECWQIDATDWTLADGRVVAIFQLNDDHSRLQIASLAARSENAQDAVRVVTTGIERHGVPQRLLSDNGAALNPIRRGWIGELTAMVTALGVHAIASSVAHPQTQGKNERGHSTLKRWLRARAPARDLDDLQSQLDQFDLLYNEHRPHQALQMMTPHACYTATPKSPTPTRPDPPHLIPVPPRHVVRTASANGAVRVARIKIMLGKAHAGQTFNILLDPQRIIIFDHQGTLLSSHDRPPAGTYIPNGKPRGFLARYEVSDPAET